MERVAQATLEDGRSIPYIIIDHPPHGAMKHTYFAPDRSYVVQFYNDERTGQDKEFYKRLKAIIGKYNPTRSEQDGGAVGGDEKIAGYFRDIFCWPTGIVTHPAFGIVCPAYAKHFYFEANASYEYNLLGKDKKSTWFTTGNRRFLARPELGDFKSMLHMSIVLTRAVRRMHQAGLAHSDLSPNNVLIDPKSGTCAVIDIDSLVVPGLYPPEVLGTYGYIAPEVLATASLPYFSPDRKAPSVYTDLHALSVLLYQYLFLRHPLAGPKIFSEEDEQNDYLRFGPAAIFIEDPMNNTNRRTDITFTLEQIGPILQKLFLRAFVDGLHNPDKRPTAMEWERGLLQTWDLLQPCQNQACSQKWFILYDTDNLSCPFCGESIHHRDIVRLKQYARQKGSKGQWYGIGEVNVYHNMPLYSWHMFSNVQHNEKSDNTPQAEIFSTGDAWAITNRQMPGMICAEGTLVPIGQRTLIRDGSMFQSSKGENGMLIQVQIRSV